MRRFGMIVTVLIMLFCVTAQANGGDEFQLHGGVTGKDTGAYYNPLMWSGPGSQYNLYDSKLSLDLDTSQVKVFTQVWNEKQLWILVEAPHRTLGKVRGYMAAIDEEGQRLFSYDDSSVPWEEAPGSFPSIWECQFYDDEPLRCGPGEEYVYTGGYFTLQDYGHVVLVDGEWALVDGISHSGENQYQRGWIPFDHLLY